MDFQQLGPYKIERKLGRGGMGTVFAAVEPTSGLAAAVKVLSIHLAQEEGFRERFEAEIETLRKLRHPNIVRLYGFGEQDGVLFYAMELVEGTSLEDELRRGRRFDWSETTRIGIQLCRALRHAHDRGIIHRDIKPANLLLLGSGPDIKLSDFGIAKLFGSSGLTADGGVIGTADYMAPEQADGRPVTHRADLYSVGGLLYALMAGRPPFQARSLPEMLHLQRYAEPDPLRVHAPDAPAELETIVRELLAKEPEQRIPNAQVLARRLEAMEHGLARRASRSATAQLADIHTSETACPAPEAAGAASSAVAPIDDPDRTQLRSIVPAAEQGSMSPGGLGETQAITNIDEAVDKIPVFWTREAAAATAAAVTEDHSFEVRAVAPSAPTSVAPANAKKPEPRFVAVSEDEDLDEIGDGGEPHPLISPQTFVLVAALLCIGGITWYFLQPPSADALYERVQAAAEQGRPERLADAEDDIQEFLNYYPEDDRWREMVKYLDEIDLYRLEARYRRGGRRTESGDDRFTPLERAYAESARLMDVDPDRGARKLRALVELYAEQPDLIPREEKCLELARRHLKRLDQDTGERSDDLARIEQRLAAADAEPDRQTARTIYAGLVELYGDKPWARSVVESAEQKLREIPPAVAKDAGGATP